MSDNPFDKLFGPPSSDLVWDKEQLEQLLYICKTVMPPKEAEKVIAVCLVKAGLETFAQSVDVVTIKVDRETKEEPWDATEIRFTVDGIKMKLEVMLDERP